jgi:opacity protein-like surface antigen
MRLNAEKCLGLIDRAIVGMLLFLVLLLVGVQAANAAEIIPAVGLTKPVEGSEEADVFGSLSLRAPLLPILKSEIGVGYRQESRFDDALHVRMWPITASLWLTPVPMLYAGGGVGWYNMTFDYDDDLPVPIEDETVQEFGVHLGGGLTMPLNASVGLDLNGRYVMLQDQESRLVPESFDPDFWTTSLGIAIKF